MRSVKIIVRNDFKKKNVKLGISDGINVEILDGVKEGDKIKVWNKASKDDEDSEDEEEEDDEIDE